MEGGICSSSRTPWPCRWVFIIDTKLHRRTRDHADMQEVIAELDFLGSMMQEVFGVISQSTVVDFEALFQDDSTPTPSPPALPPLPPLPRASESGHGHSHITL